MVEVAERADMARNRSAGGGGGVVGGGIGYLLSATLKYGGSIVKI